MISVSCDKTGSPERVGLEHFIQTYGLIPGGLPLSLAYGSSASKDSRFKITVADDCEVGFEEIARCAWEISDGILNGAVDGLPFIHCGRNSTDVALDIFSFTGKCLGGELEHFWKNVPKPERQELGKIPFIDIYERLLFLVILRAAGELRVPIVCKSPWPGKRFAVCLTHDVDEVKKTYQWITRPLLYLKNMQARMLKNQLYSLWYKLRGKEPFWTFDDIMRLEDSLNVKSSFYFLNERGKARVLSPDTWKLLGRRYDFNAPGVRKLMRELSSGGWEVGLHGSYGSYDDFELLEKEKNMLQSSVGGEISGIRQHHLNLSPRTWEYHERAGLRYDTTLGFKDQMGWRGGTCMPFHPVCGNKKLNLLEIPLAIMDTPLFRCGGPGGFGEMVNTVCSLNGVLTLLWHHAVFNEYEYPGWSRAYEEVIGLCRKKDAWITCARELSDWWMQREKANFDLEYEGECLRIVPHAKEGCHFLNVYLPEGMAVEKLQNAHIIGSGEGVVAVRTVRLKNHEHVELELVDHGS